MILTLTFYKIDEQNKKVFLQAAISNHPLWSCLDFWECSIINSIREEFKCQHVYHMSQKESEDEVLVRERNIIFGQLVSEGSSV